MNYRIIKSITLMKLDLIRRIEVSIPMIIEELIEGITSMNKSLTAFLIIRADGQKLPAMIIF